MPNKSVVLVRHAETFYNIKESDDLDSDLTPLGVTQAVGVAEYLRDSGDAEGHVGLVSPYKRTLDTAQAIHEKTGIQFRVFPLLAEYAAKWSRVSYPKFIPNRKDDYPSFDWSLYERGHLFIAESFEAFMDRMFALKSELPEKCLLVSHGGVVYTLADLLVGSDGSEKHSSEYAKATNASVTKIVNSETLYLFKNDWKGFSDERAS